MKKSVSVEEAIARIDAVLKENETPNETKGVSSDTDTIAASPTLHAIGAFPATEQGLSSRRELHDQMVRNQINNDDFLQRSCTNYLDRIGDVFSIQRIEGETDEVYRQRLLDIFSPQNF